MGEWVPDNKKLSGQLLSQIHFCRFFYKLMERMNGLEESASPLKDMMKSIISGRLADIKHLRLINPRYATIYRRTKEF